MMGLMASFLAGSMWADDAVGGGDGGDQLLGQGPLKDGLKDQAENMAHNELRLRGLISRDLEI
jgi:hypothetical protein